MNTVIVDEYSKNLLHKVTLDEYNDIKEMQWY